MMTTHPHFEKYIDLQITTIQNQNITSCLEIYKISNKLLIYITKSIKNANLKKKTQLKMQTIFKKSITYPKTLN